MTEKERLLITTGAAVKVAGKYRTFRYTAPSDLATGAALLIVFHGSFQTGQQIRGFSGGTFDELADRERLVVAFPDAYKRLWNDARIAANYPARRDGYDDVAFFRALVAYFVEAEGIDAGRVYVAGYSNGAQFVNRLIHEAGAELAGAAMIAATQPVPENFPTGMPSTAVPVMLIHGTRDRLVPYHGGVASFWGFLPRGRGLSHLATAEYLAARNGINSAPNTQKLPTPAAERTSLTVRDWRAPGKHPVRAYTVEGGGHVIPNPHKAAAAFLGRTNKDLDSARAIWSFFAEDQKNGKDISLPGKPFSPDAHGDDSEN